MVFTSHTFEGGIEVVEPSFIIFKVFKVLFWSFEKLSIWVTGQGVEMDNSKVQDVLKGPVPNSLCCDCISISNMMTRVVYLYANNVIRNR